MLDVIGWIGLLTLPAFLLLDLVHRARRYDPPRAWRVRALLVSAFMFFFSMKVGEWWGAHLPGVSLFDGAALGTAGGALVGILVYELFHYAYHRAAHRFDFLWRAAHQMHHSAESLDAFGAYFLHPLDVVAFTSLPVLVLYPLLGLSAEAGALAATFVGFNGVFQHANVRTPRWLGYLIQRPESHEIHHARDVHRYNYADLPLWDMVFGTFRNPDRAGRPVGFAKGASARVPEMLIGRDVSRPPRRAAVTVASETRRRAPTSV